MLLSLLLVLLAALASAQQAGPEELLKLAVHEQQSGNLAGAIRHYRQILQMRPGMMVAQVNLGAALSDTGQYDQAIALFIEALLSAPDKKPVRMNLALAYYRKGDFANVRAQLAEVHRLEPGDIKASRLLANVDLQAGRPQEALALLDPLAAANETDMDFQYLYGTSLIAAGRAAEGALRVEKVARTTNRGDAYLVAGSALFRLNQFEAARQDLESALRLDPKLPGLYTLLGLARDKTGDAQAAEPAFRKALQLNPDDFQANLTLGAILYKRRALGEARRLLDRALRLSPNDPTARYESGMLKIASGELDAAAEQLAPLTRENPGWIEPHIALATLYYRLHRPADGARERQAVERITAEQQASGPAKP